MNNNKLLLETLAYAVQALALSNSIRDIILTDEQREQIPDLFRKHAVELFKQACLRLGLSYENILQEMPQVAFDASAL
jgi:hypothetical protein